MINCSFTDPSCNKEELADENTDDQVQSSLLFIQELLELAIVTESAVGLYP